MATPLPADLLTDARAAYHQLLTGKSVVTVRDSNGESVTYNIASADKLKAYIDELAVEVSGVSRVSAPMRVFM